MVCFRTCSSYLVAWPARSLPESSACWCPACFPASPWESRKLGEYQVYPGQLQLRPVWRHRASLEASCVSGHCSSSVHCGGWAQRSPSVNGADREVFKPRLMSLVLLLLFCYYHLGFLVPAIRLNSSKQGECMLHSLTVAMARSLLLSIAACMPPNTGCTLLWEPWQQTETGAKAYHMR